MTTPTISNVSGTIATGQTLTITGTNMMDENRINWILPIGATSVVNFEQCNGITPESDGWSPSNGVWGSAGYSTADYLMGNKSLLSVMHGSITSPNYNGNRGYFSWNPVNDVYIRWYFKYIKHTWGSIFDNLLDKSGGWVKQSLCFTTNNNFLIYFQPTYIFQEGNDTITRTWSISVGYNDNNTCGPDFRTPFNVGKDVNIDSWHCAELRYDAITSSVQSWIDGNLISNYTASQTCKTPIYLQELGYINTSAEIDTNDYWMYLNGFAISTSRIYPSSTIEIANSSNYSTATKIYQEPIYLSDSSVQIKVNLTDLGSGPYYLFVTNNRQETSLPYSLSSTCPNVECSFQLNII